MEDTGLGIHKLEIICMGYRCPNVHMFKISVSWIEYKSAKNPPVLHVFIRTVEDTGASSMYVHVPVPMVVKILVKGQIWPN